ncbi:serine protease [Halalkalibacter kiskunsagensis]|uniref:Serine protease n=1 Tax=Halalkalibacter kiskunsagensis TaxID=1548599 RepID=A0ABV6K9U4_9BACI
MKVNDIQEKIHQLQDQLNYWENHLKDVQNDCNHDYQEDSFYKKCIRCQKIEAIYY